MNLFQRATVGLLMSGVTALTTAPAIAAGTGAYQEADWHQHLRGVVDRTENDLQAANQLAQGPAERVRYRTAQTRLANFDRTLAKGQYDSAKMNAAIAALQDILNHNTLQASTRDALKADLNDHGVAARAVAGAG